MDDLRAEKAQLRARMRQARDALPAAARARLSRLAEQRALALLDRLDPKTVMVFSSFGSEIGTQGVIEQLDHGGRRVALPVVAGREMRAAAFRPGDAVRTARYGAAEPASPDEVEPASIDVVIIPGLAFDPEGYRVGYGGGHYDRFLIRLRPETPRIGIAFHCQIVPHVPHDGSDERVDAVVTDAAIILCRPERLKDRVPRPCD